MQLCLINHYFDFLFLFLFLFSHVNLEYGLTEVHYYSLPRTLTLKI